MLPAPRCSAPATHHTRFPAAAHGAVGRDAGHPPMLPALLLGLLAKGLSKGQASQHLQRPRSLANRLRPSHRRPGFDFVQQLHPESRLAHTQETR